MMRSLGARLAVGTALTSAAILGLLGIAVYVAVRGVLISEFDATLLAKAQSLASMVEQHNGKVDFEFDVLDMPEFGQGRQPEYFQLWVSGHWFDQSPSMAGNSLGIKPDAQASGSYRNLILPDGRSGRVVVFRFSAHVENDNDQAPHVVGSPAVLAVARDTSDVDRTLLNVRWILFGLCAGAIVISAGTMLLVVRRTIQPMKALANQIEALRETALSTQLDPRGIPVELAPVVDKLNGLLVRLDEAFERERAFAADVAHELRTPLAGLRTTLQVCRSRPRDVEVYQEAIDKSLDMLAAMHGLVENLLLLARAESGQLQSYPAEMDMTSLMRESWAAFAGKAAEKRVTVRWAVPEVCVAHCDATTLRIVLNNIFDNAADYVDAGGEIDISLAMKANRLFFSVANTGTLIGEGEVPKLVERFWRKDASRSQTGLHAGLGLSLCHRLVAVAGGTIHIESRAGERFVIQVSLEADEGNVGEVEAISGECVAPEAAR